MAKGKAIATISIGADPRKLEKDLESARKKLRAFARDAKKILGKQNPLGAQMGKALKGAGGLVGKVAGGVGGVLGGGFGIAAAGGIIDMAGDVLAFEKTLTRFQIAAGKSDAQMGKFRASILEVSTATGVSSSEILGGAQTYVDLTGDVAGAEKAMNSFARIAQASGSSVSDIATAAAAMQQSFGLDPGDIEATFSGMISQGKMGAVSLKDFAGELASLAPRWAKFNEATTKTGVAEFGAAFQVARQGFGSASEAATGLEALMGALNQNAKKFEASGVKIFDKNPKTGVRTMRTFDQIMASIGSSKLMKDPTLLAKAMGSKEAAQTFDMLSKNKKLFDELVVAGMDAGAVQRDLDIYQQSAAGKIEKAWNDAKVSLAAAFTPERIHAFADALGRAAEIFAKIVGYVDWLIDHMPADAKTEGARSIAIDERMKIDNQNLSEPQRKAALAKRALELAANPGGADDGTAMGMIRSNLAGDAGTLEAARELAKEAGILLPQDDNWRGRGGPSGEDQTGAGATAAAAAVADQAKATAAMVAAAITKGMSGVNFVVQLDAGKVNQKLDNATTHRKGR